METAHHPAGRQGQSEFIVNVVHGHSFETALSGWPSIALSPFWRRAQPSRFCKGRHVSRRTRPKPTFPSADFISDRLEPLGAHWCFRGCVSHAAEQSRKTAETAGGPKPMKRRTTPTL